MDYVATQPSSLPLNSGAYTAEEYDDVLCILQPASQSAITICENIWKTTPCFILQFSNAGLRADGTVREEEDVDLEMIGGEDTQGAKNPAKIRTPVIPEVPKFLHPEIANQGPLENQNISPTKTEVIEETQPLQPANLDIALRTSSVVKDYISGFVFGRDLKVADIKLATGGPGDPRISSAHFRIHLNQYGILMLEDSSTNGTIVDDEHLGRNARNRSKILVHGSTIEFVANANKATKRVEKAVFIVKLPERNDARYKENLERYVAKLARHKRDREQTADGTLFPKPTAYPGHVKSDASTKTHYLSAGTERNTLAGGWTASGKYKVIGEIGKGAFAMVYRVSSTVGGIVRAAKQIDRAAFMKNGVVDGKLLNELVIMQKVDHPHIVHFVDYDLTAKFLYIIMEHVPCGDMAPYAFRKTFLGIPMLKSIMRQVLHALAYIHRNGIVHRDIKPENILVSDKDPFIVKLSDFGLSKMIGDETPVMVTFCGTLLYCAPEIYPDYEQVKAGLPRAKRKSSATKPYSSAVDIWSLGTVMYHLLASKPPFKGTGEDQGYKMLRAVMFDEIDYSPLYDRGVDSYGVAFLNSMIDIDGESRPSATELLLHPWMQDVPDIIPIPNLEESQIIGNRESDALETLEEEDEWDRIQSDSFLKAAGALLHTPTPDAPSLTNGETSAEDKVPITENDFSDGSSQVDVESAASSHISPDLARQANHGWQSEAALGSVQANQRWFKKGWPSYQSQEHSVDEGASSSEEDTTQQGRPAKLFGEVSQDPNGESGVFGGESQPTIRPLDRSQKSTSHNSSSLFGAESRMNNLNMKASRPNQSVLRSAITNSILHGKRYRSTTASGSDESNTSSVEEPAAKRSMIMFGEPIEAVENMAAAKNPPKKVPIPDVSDTLSQQVDEMQLSGTRLATLSPIPGCICDKEVFLTTRLSTFGRALNNTNVFECDPKDHRVPRWAFDIYFYSPGTAHIRGTTWHKDSDVNAVVMTRCSTGIKVNGTHIPTSPAGNVFKIAKLRTGDLLEVYNSGRNKLVYTCVFHVSESQVARREDEDVIVEDNAELCEAATNAANGPAPAVAAVTPAATPVKAGSG